MHHLNQLPGGREEGCESVPREACGMRPEKKAKQVRPPGTCDGAPGRKARRPGQPRCRQVETARPRAEESRTPRSRKEKPAQKRLGGVPAPVEPRQHRCPMSAERWAEFYVLPALPSSDAALLRLHQWQWLQPWLPRFVQTTGVALNYVVVPFQRHHLQRQCRSSQHDFADAVYEALRFPAAPPPSCCRLGQRWQWRTAGTV